MIAFVEPCNKSTDVIGIKLGVSRIFVSCFNIVGNFFFNLCIFYILLFLTICVCMKGGAPAPSHPLCISLVKLYYIIKTIYNETWMKNTLTYWHWSHYLQLIHDTSQSFTMLGLARYRLHKLNGLKLNNFRAFLIICLCWLVLIRYAFLSPMLRTMKQSEFQERLIIKTSDFDLNVVKILSMYFKNFAGLRF